MLCWGEGQREAESNREAVIIIVDELAFPVASELSLALRESPGLLNQGEKQQREALAGANSTTKDRKQPAASAGLKTLTMSVSVFCLLMCLFMGRCPKKRDIIIEVCSVTDFTRA